MKTGAAIALGIGGFLLLSRQQAAAQTAAARASSPVAAAQNGIAALENSLLSLLKPSTKAPAPAPKGAGGSGFNPAGGSGSGRSAGGTTPTSPVESVFDAFPNFNGTNVIDAGPTGAAFEPGGIFSDPSAFAENQPDLSNQPAEDPVAENSLIDSMVQESSGVPIFDPGPAPPDDTGVDPGQDFEDPGFF
jgi:hypothetical protein